MSPFSEAFCRWFVSVMGRQPVPDRPADMLKSEAFEAGWDARAMEPPEDLGRDE